MDNIIVFPWKGDFCGNPSRLKLTGNPNDRFLEFLSCLNNIEGVMAMGNVYRNVLNDVYLPIDITGRGIHLHRQMLVKSPMVGHGFVEILGIELLEGKIFSRECNNYGKVILNEACAKLFGVERPVGRTFRANRSIEVIGVVKDFCRQPLPYGQGPLIFRFDPNGGTILLKLRTGTEMATLERIARLYREFLPGLGFEFTFLEDGRQALFTLRDKD